MTTITASTSESARGPASGTQRVWNVVKLQFTNRFNVIALPWIILAAIFLVNYLIWVIIVQSSSSPDSADAMEGTQYSGSTFFMFVYMMILAIQAINLTFPFALGYSVTRRDYYLGTAVAWGILAAMLTAGFFILSYLEQWTGGWGLNAHFFTAIYFGQDNPGLRLFTLFAGFLFFFFVGTFSATIYVRWRLNGILAAGIALAFVLVGLIALATFTKSWGAFGQWVVTSGPTGIMAWSLILTAAAAVAGYVILQRATPKS